MNLKERPSSENWTMPFTMFGSQLQQKWDDPSTLDCSTRIPPSFSKTNQPCENSFLLNVNPDNQTKITNQEEDWMNQMLLGTARTQDWDPRAMLNNLSFLEQKIHQLQELIHMIFPGSQDELVTQQQQQLITADLTSIIVQLISTAGKLLPTVKHSLSAANPSATQLNAVTEMNCNSVDEEHESIHDDDGKEEHLSPGSYSILQLEKEEILAPHTHFCTICGKGFKRDANLRMHMRGHGDEYKTPAALAKPNKESASEQVVLKRYSCPVVGCKRNKDHNKFQPLKTILCVKNHYKRTHCDKSYICSRCHTKKFSVIADLKTHEKHCGRDKWLCSCGTTFSRKDKLFGHIALFQGHTPAIPLEKVANVGFGNGVESLMDVKGSVEDPYLSLLNYDCSVGGIQDLPQANFDDSSSPFSFLISGEKSGIQWD